MFEAVHELTLRLVNQGLVTGLRIDHADGLLDPGRYLRTLQERCAGAPFRSSGWGHPAAPADSSRPFYIIVEKILTGRERLHQDWPSLRYDRLRVRQPAQRRLRGQREPSSV